jgi:hypothetical protein
MSRAAHTLNRVSIGDFSRPSENKSANKIPAAAGHIRVDTAKNAAYHGRGRSFVSDTGNGNGPRSGMCRHAYRREILVLERYLATKRWIPIKGTTYTHKVEYYGGAGLFWRRVIDKARSSHAQNGAAGHPSKYTSYSSSAILHDDNIMAHLC